MQYLDSISKGTSCEVSGHTVHLLHQNKFVETNDTKKKLVCYFLQSHKFLQIFQLLKEVKGELREANPL